MMSGNDTSQFAPSPIREDGPRRGTFTSPRRERDVTAIDEWTTALDIGGTHITSAIVTSDLRVHDERRYPLDADAPTCELLDGIADGVDASRVRRGRIAIALPGPFDYARGIGDFRGVEKFTALRDVDVRTGLATRWGRDPKVIRFVNDAEAFGLGEWAEGAGERVPRCVAVTLGTGIGSAFIVDGRCVTGGPTVPMDGNIHTVRICGLPLEEVVSRAALMDSFRQRTGQQVDVAEIAGLARDGNRAACQVLEEKMTLLGQALAPWLSAFAAQRLVVGGSMSASSDLLFPPLSGQLAESMHGAAPLVLQGALPEERASLIGACVATSQD